MLACSFYDHAQLPGAIIIFVLVLLELIAMYLQARNASETEMDKRLGVASHRNKDDVAKEVMILCGRLIRS